MKHKFKIGDKVIQEFGTQVMEVKAFEPELIEDVITEWEDEQGNVNTAKFMASQLHAAK